MRESACPQINTNYNTLTNLCEWDRIQSTDPRDGWRKRGGGFAKDWIWNQVSVSATSLSSARRHTSRKSSLKARRLGLPEWFGGGKRIWAARAACQQSCMRERRLSPHSS